MKHSLIALVFTCLFISCGKQKHHSQALLDRINNSVETQQLNLAKQQIDSLNTLFRENIALRKIANKLLYEIELVELEKNMAYFSEQIPQKKLEMDSIFQYFVFNKTEPYQSEGEYVHRDVARNSDPTATYLKVHLKDSGEVFLISIYCGAKDCPYQSIRASSGGFFVASPEISTSQSNNYTFSDGDYHWRMLLFSEKESIDMIRFIAASADDDITISLVGNGCLFEYLLDEKRKKTICDTYYLSVLIKEVKDLQINVINTQKQIESVKRKIAYSAQ